MKKTHQQLTFACLLLCSTSVQAFGFGQRDTEVHDTEQMFKSVAACDQSTNPAFYALRGKVPLSFQEAMDPPAVRTLLDYRTPSADDMALLASFNESNRQCMNEVSWLVDKNFSPRFSKAFREFLYKSTEQTMRLSHGKGSYGQARKVIYAAAVVMQNEFDEYRFRYTDGKLSTPEEFALGQTCVIDYSKVEPSDALAIALKRTKSEMMNDSECWVEKERSQSRTERHFYESSN